MGRVVLPAADVTEMLTPEWLAFANNPGNRVKARVVLDGNRPLAIGSLSHNPLHPVPRYLSLKLAESADPECLTRLFDALVSAMEASEGSHPIHLSIVPSDRLMINWAEGEGFLPIMTTWIGSIPPGVARGEVCGGLHRLSDYDTPAIRRSLAKLHAQIYRKQHRWNESADILPEMAERLFMSESDLIPEFMWYASNEFGQPVGVSSLRRSRVPQAFDLGWIGICEGIPSNVPEELLGQAIASAGNKALTIEVDEADAMTLRCLTRLPVTWDDRLIRFERPALR